MDYVTVAISRTFRHVIYKRLCQTLCVETMTMHNLITVNHMQARNYNIIIIHKN